MRYAMNISTTLGPLLRHPLAWSAGVVAFTAIFLVVTGDKLATSPAYALSMAVMLGAVVLMLIDFRVALLLFVAFLFAYEEFNLTSQEAFVDKSIANTVLAVKVFGFALMDVLSIVLLIPVLLREWRHMLEHGRWRWLRGDLFLLPLILVWLYGMIPGIVHMRSFSDYTWDLRMLAHVLIFYFIFSRTFSARRDIVLALLVGAGVFVLKHGLFFYRYLTGGGLQTGVYHRVLLGSDLPLTALALALTLASLLIFRRHFAAGNTLPLLRPALLLLAVYFVVMLIAGLGKLTYLQAIYSLALIAVLHRRDIRPRTVLAVVGLSAGAAMLVFFTVLSAESRNAILYALTSAFNWWDALKLYGDLSFGTRLLEIINVWDQLTREGGLLLGQGWGAAWRETAVHMPFDGGAFSVEEQHSGIHVQTHIDAITFLLKVGIVGTIAIYASMLRFGLEGLRMYRATRESWHRWALMALVLMIIIFVPNYLYFIRLKYLLGFAFAGITIFMATHDSNKSNHTGITHPDHEE
ncbi:MAG: hypothetical protein RRA94_00210 [Bacteroidota bacterium]|nr:hypothetical protein [Bacteroidota bacterium]